MINRSALTDQFITYIQKQHANHPHRDIAIRVLYCIKYIRFDLDEIKKHAGKDSLLRDMNNMAFHLHGLDTPDAVEKQFTQLIAEVDSCLAGLLSMDNDAIGDQVISTFLNHINDSDVGCMEVRLRNALNFYVTYQSVGLLSLNDLMQDVYQNINTKISVRKLLESFGNMVDAELPVINQHREIVTLTWSLIHDYIENTLRQDIQEDWMKFGEEIKCKIKQEGKMYRVYATEESVNLYLSYIKSILPSPFQDSIAKASIKLINGKYYFNSAFYFNSLYYFKLSPSQYKAFNRIICSSIRKNTFTDPADQFANKIAEKFSQEGALVKSVRTDDKDFDNKFMLGITKSPENQPIEDQRKGPHRKYTVFASGAYERSQRPSPYPHLTSEQIAEEKKTRSNFQSTSLVTPTAHTPVFGHNREKRADKQVGYAFSRHNPMINRVFKYDNGTVNRPYEFDTYEDAINYLAKKTDPVQPILFSSLEELEKHIAGKDETYTEVLAHLKWEMESSAVCIYSDTFEARCIAQFRAKKLQARLKKWYQELGQPWDETYEVPILFYIPNSEKEWTVYTKAEQMQDRKDANEIYLDEEKLKNKLEAGDYDFLLLVNNPDYVFWLEVNGRPLLEDLLRRKQFHIVESLLIRANEEMIEQYFHKISLRDLSVRGYFEFMIDNYLVAFLATSIVFPVIPIFYFGIFIAYIAKSETLLHQAAELGHLCLKQLLINTKQDVNAKNSFSKTALHIAAKNGHTEIVKMLLEDSRVDANITTDSFFKETALSLAVANGHVETVKAMLACERVDVNFVINGYPVLFCADIVNNKEMLDVLYNCPRVDINAEDNVGHTLLDYRVLIRDMEFIRKIITDPRTNAKTINAAILYAAERGLKKPIELLLQDERVDFNLDFGKVSSDEIRDLIVDAQLKQYEKYLTQRELEYEPRFPQLHQLGFFVGKHKDEKQIAINDLYHAKENNVKMTNRDSIDVLHDGRLGKIIKRFSAETKRQMGL